MFRNEQRGIQFIWGKSILSNTTRNGYKNFHTLMSGSPCCHRILPATFGLLASVFAVPVIVNIKSLQYYFRKFKHFTFRSYEIKSIASFYSYSILVMQLTRDSVASNPEGTGSLSKRVATRSTNISSIVYIPSWISVFHLQLQIKVGSI